MTTVSNFLRGQTLEEAKAELKENTKQLNEVNRSNEILQQAIDVRNELKQKKKELTKKKYDKTLTVLNKIIDFVKAANNKRKENISTRTTTESNRFPSMLQEHE